MKKLILGLLVLGFTTQFYAQVIALPEIEVHAMNYKYLKNVDNSTAPVNVRMLEQKVANYDLKSSDFYEETFDLYTVSFYIPDGSIVAAYDSDGEILYTIEKFKNVKPPRAVINSVTKRFPGWGISKDVYKVSYRNDKALKTYKLILENGDKKMRIKTDENGKFI